jgi:uncharacterized membrane protein YphA (DoxX/SURF4 family)
MAKAKQCSWSMTRAMAAFAAILMLVELCTLLHFWRTMPPARFSHYLQLSWPGMLMIFLVYPVLTVVLHLESKARERRSMTAR